MSPNLSFEHLAIVLALAGCSKATPAADGVRSDPGATASSQPVIQGAPPREEQVATATATAPASPSPVRSGASANELKKKMGGDGHTGQASCGAGSCTSEIKKK